MIVFDDLKFILILCIYAFINSLRQFVDIKIEMMDLFAYS